MSKSLGNFTDLLDFVAGPIPRPYRLLVLRSHYRAPIEVTKETVADAEQGLKRLDSFARRFADAARAAEPDADALDAVPRAHGRRPRARPRRSPCCSISWRGPTRTTTCAAAAAAFSICEAVGLELHSEAGEIADDAPSVARRRDEARAAKDWATADALRDELTRWATSSRTAPTAPSSAPADVARTVRRERT